MLFANKDPKHGQIPNLSEIILYFEGNWGGRIFAHDVLDNEQIPSLLQIRRLVPAPILDHDQLRVCLPNDSPEGCTKLHKIVKPCTDDSAFPEACGLNVKVQTSPFESRGSDEDALVPIDPGQQPSDDIFLL